MARIKKKIGELLLEENLITEEQLTEALEAQKMTGQKIGQVLVNKGFVKEEDLYKILSEKICKFRRLFNKW